MGPPGIDAIFAQTVEQLRQKPQFDLLSDPDIVIKPVTTRSGGLDPSPLSSASPEGRELMGWSENAGEFQDLSAFSDPSP